MKVTVQISAPHQNGTAVGRVNGRHVTIDRTTNRGRSGEGLTSGELFCLALGSGYADELFQEAEHRQIRIDRVHVSVEAESGLRGTTPRNMALSVRVEASADEPTVMELIEHTDRTSNVLKLLRLGTSVRVADAELLTKPQPRSII
jgi:uncharacterized OsmC-like protein